MTKTKLLLSILLLLTFWPFALIWSIDTLFNFFIPINSKTWIAAVFITLIFTVSKINIELK